MAAGSRVGPMMPAAFAVAPLSEGAFNIGSLEVPWSWVIFLAIIVLGLLLIRTAITLVKVAIVVAIAIGLYLIVSWLLHHF
jgi:hypothetical protein